MSVSKLCITTNRRSLENFAHVEVQSPDITIQYGIPDIGELTKLAHPDYQILIFPEHKCEARLCWRTAGGKLVERTIQGRNICTIEKRVVHSLYWAKKAPLVVLRVSAEFNRRNNGTAMPGVTIKSEWEYDCGKTGIQGFGEYFAELCHETELPPPDYVHGLGLAQAARIVKACHNRPAEKSPAGLGAALMAKLDDHIKTNLLGDTSVSALARIACLGKDQFTRRFKRATGKTPHKYVFEIKTQCARRLKSEGNMYSSEIAAAAGFYDQSHMSRHIRQARRETRKEKRREKRREKP